MAKYSYTIRRTEPVGNKDQRKVRYYVNGTRVTYLTYHNVQICMGQDSFRTYSPKPHLITHEHRIFSDSPNANYRF